MHVLGGHAVHARRLEEVRRLHRATHPTQPVIITRDRNGIFQLGVDCSHGEDGKLQNDQEGCE